jgi:hypothetical protein
VSRKLLSVLDETETLILNDNEIIHCCKGYKYLVVVLNQKGTDDKEIKARTVQSRKAIGTLSGILWNPKITK